MLRCLEPTVGECIHCYDLEADGVATGAGVSVGVGVADGDALTDGLGVMPSFVSRAADTVA
jgi:hypothetical protein